MAKAKIKRNDTVVVITGAQKGKRGRVLRVDRARERVFVEGVNLRKKAQRRSADQPQGGIIELECPIHISNVMLEDVFLAKHPDGEAAPADETAAAPTDSDS